MNGRPNTLLFVFGVLHTQLPTVPPHDHAPAPPHGGRCSLTPSVMHAVAPAAREVRGVRGQHTQECLRVCRAAWLCCHTPLLTGRPTVRDCSGWCRVGGDGGGVRVGGSGGGRGGSAPHRAYDNTRTPAVRAPSREPFFAAPLTVGLAFACSPPEWSAFGLDDHRMWTQELDKATRDATGRDNPPAPKKETSP